MNKKIIILQDVPLFHNINGNQLEIKASRGDEFTIIKEEYDFDGRTWFQTTLGWLMGITQTKECFVHKCYLG